MDIFLIQTKSMHAAGGWRGSAAVRSASGRQLFSHLLTYEAMPEACLAKRLFAGEHYIQFLFGVNRVRANLGKLVGTGGPAAQVAEARSKGGGDEESAGAKAPDNLPS